MIYIVHVGYKKLGSYKSIKGAKIAIARRWRRLINPGISITPYDKFYANMPYVETINIVTNEKIMIPLCDKGTCNDPGMELYWSM